MPLTKIDDLAAHPHNYEEGLLVLDSLSRRVEEFLENEEEDGNERAPGVHASELSGCQRRLVYGIMGTKRLGKSSYIWKRRFRMGHVIHNMLQEEFKRFQYSPRHFTRFQEEVKLSPEFQAIAAQWDIHSHCDGIFEIGEKDTGLLLLRLCLEIKSMNPDEFDRLTKPKAEHVEQVHIYMKCLDLPLTWLLYFNKANANYTKSSDRRFIVPFNPKLWEELEDRMDRAHQKAALQQLPDREESIACSFCPFAYTCQPPSLTKYTKGLTNPRFMK